MEVLDSLSGIRVSHEEYHATKRATLSIEINGDIENVRCTKARLRELLVDEALRVVWTDETESETSK